MYVRAFELVGCALLGGEGLHHAHAAQRFSEVSGDVCHALTRAAIGTGGVVAKRQSGGEHQREDDVHRERELRVHGEQERFDQHQVEEIDEHHEYTLGDELRERFHVVGEA